MAERRLRSSEAVVGSSELQSARDRTQLSLSGPMLAKLSPSHTASHDQPRPATPRCLAIVVVYYTNHFVFLPVLVVAAAARCRHLGTPSTFQEMQEICTRSQSQRRIEGTHSTSLQVLGRRTTLTR